MKYTIKDYLHLLHLQDAEFQKIDHEDAMVSIVYKITQISGKALILKICDRESDYLREVHFLNHFREILPVPKVLKVIPQHRAILMEYRVGTLLKPQDLNEKLAFEIGSCLAKIHLQGLSGYGDPIQSSLNSDPRAYFTLKFEEGLHECNDHLPKNLIEKCRDFYTKNVDFLLTVDGPCIAHRDFRPGNLIIHNGKLHGIIDWAGARASFAEEDLCSFEHSEWFNCEQQKHVLLTGYASVRNLPNYAPLVSFLRLSKAIATIGFLIKKGTWNNKNSALYLYNRQFLDQLLCT